MKNIDFYIYYRYDEKSDSYVALHFTSCGECHNHSDGGVVLSVEDLSNAVRGFRATYKSVWDKPYE